MVAVAPRVFIDFSVDSAPLGRVIVELFNVSAPRTAENFRALCTGERGVSPLSQIALYYKHSKMHRVIPDFMIQGGDFTKGNGTGGESIYGGPFSDEDLSRPVDEAGLLVMANKGPNTNNSQFFITLRPCPHLTGKHVVFGRVLRGFENVVQRIASVPTDAKDRPNVPVEIVNCGELELKRPPPKPAKEVSASADESVDSDRGRKQKKHRRDSNSRSRSRTRSISVSRSRSLSSASDRTDDEAERKRRRKRARKEKKEKKKKDSKKRKQPSRSLSPVPGVPREETEEEYDARLEYEERERKEEARIRELAEIKRRYEAEREKARLDSENSGGVRYKGRGRMKYVDPEMRSKRTED